jgi:hypothetical protein
MPAVVLGDKKQFEGGATRSNDLEPVALHLLPWEGLLIWAQRMEEGRLSHGPDNWRGGFPMSECFNRALKHLYAYREKGDLRDLGAVMCNVAFMAHFAMRRPELNDLGHPEALPELPPAPHAS